MSEDVPLEKRVKPKLPRTVARRLKALENLPPGLARSVLETCDTPILIYERLREKAHNATYANPAAINTFGSPFEQIMQFTATLDIGEKEETRFDNLLTACSREGWAELNDLVLRIPTEDEKILRISPYLRHHNEYGRDYWTAFINKDNVRKFKPNSWTARTISFFERIHRAFKGDRIFMQAPEYVDKAFVDEASQRIAPIPAYNLVIDFKRTQGVEDTGAEKGPLQVLKEMSKTFHKQLFLVNTPDPLYQLLDLHKVSRDNIYRSKAPQLSISFA